MCFFDKKKSVKKTFKSYKGKIGVRSDPDEGFSTHWASSA